MVAMGLCADESGQTLPGGREWQVEGPEEPPAGSPGEGTCLLGAAERRGGIGGRREEATFVVRDGGQCRVLNGQAGGFRHAHKAMVTRGVPWEVL